MVGLCKLRCYSASETVGAHTEPRARVSGVYVTKGALGERINKGWDIAGVLGFSTTVE